MTQVSHENERALHLEILIQLKHEAEQLRELQVAVLLEWSLGKACDGA